MACLAQLVDSRHYRACDWDLKADAAGRAYWLRLFRWHVDAVVIPHIRRVYAQPDADALAEFRTQYLAAFDEIESRPESFERLDVLFFTEQRERLARQYGWTDPFADVKRHENEAAVALLPETLAELDAAAEPRRRELLTVGLMAGNIFDLGSRATVERHQQGDAAFGQARAAQPPRPWHIDDVDAWWQRWSARPYRHAVFFVDNAGGDVLLGCLPLARWMMQAGACVTLAANSAPALNDITAAELEPLVQRCAACDGVLAAAVRERRLSVLPTGSTAPLLDLTRLAPEFVAATRAADLLILHGMGRAIESNYEARCACDVLRTAVLKDEGVAARLGGRLFDCVFRLSAPACPGA